KMGEQTFRILRLLLDANGEMVTREELRDKLWARDTFVDFDHGLNSAVQRLRDCLSDSAENPRWIETVPRRGYRFMAQVTWQDDNKIPRPVGSEPQNLETSRSAEPRTAINAETAERSISQSAEMTLAPSERKPVGVRVASLVALALIGTAA